MRTGLLSLLSALLLGANPALGYDLDQHLWRHRLLVLVAPDRQDGAVQAQLRAIENRRDAIQDRDIRVIQLFGDGGLADGQHLDADTSGRLRQRLDLDATAGALLLVGKDGEVKRRVQLDAGLGAGLTPIFAQIDEMPMRRAEMRRKREAGLPVTEP